MYRKPRILFCGEATYTNSGFAVYQKEVMDRFHATGKYELAELASYGDMEDGRWQSVPWKYYPVKPNMQNLEEVQRYNSSDLNQFGQWRFEPTCIDFKPDIVCVPPGTPVMSQDGYRPIESFKIGDLVLTHQGRWRPVQALMRRQHIGDIRHIFFNGATKPAVLTDNHPMLVYKKRPRTNKLRTRSQIYAGVQPEFVPANEVHAGDQIVITPPSLTDTPAVLQIRHYLDNFVCEDGRISTVQHADDATLPETLEIGEDLGRLIGLYLGDGCCHNRGVTFTFHSEEDRFTQDVIAIIAKLFGIAAYAVPVEGKKATNVHAHSVLLAELFRKWLGAKTNKHIPKEIWFGNQKAMEGVLSGLVRSDGCYKQNTVGITSVSPMLANDYRMLCSTLRIPTSIGFNRRAGLNGAYEINGYGESAKSMHVIAQKHDSVIGLVETSKRCRRTQFINGHLVATVRRTRKMPYRGQVYNIDVEEDHSYVIHQSCVHNCDIRDWWMGEHQQRSPFRPYFHWAIMPTVDSIPQDEQWLATYADADAVFTYTDWGLDVLRQSSGDHIKTKCAAPPGANFEKFFPAPDKRAHRRAMGFDEDSLIVGTVMRNQVRKLYPDLIEAFADYLKTAPVDLAEKTFLYLHTSWPDLGWDIPKLIKEAGISHKTIFTYVCNKCGSIFPAHFADATCHCNKCGEYSAKFPNSNAGISTAMLANVYRFMDVYVQYATNEGFGMPMAEAAACGVPVMAVDYSAMSDVVRKVHGIPIEVQRYTRDPGTQTKRALPDNQDFVQKLIKFFSKPSVSREKVGRAASLATRKYYDYDKTAKIWMDHFDSLELPSHDLTWNSPAKIHKPNIAVPAGLNDEEFVRWGMSNIAGRPDLVNAYTGLRMIRDLSWGRTIAHMGGMYINEMSTLGIQERIEHFNRDIATDRMLDLCENGNAWERARTK